MSDYVPIQVPEAPTDFKHVVDLTANQQEMYQKVLSKFSDSEYKLPGQEKDGSLTESEKFWLVSTLWSIFGIENLQTINPRCADSRMLTALLTGKQMEFG